MVMVLGLKFLIISKLQRLFLQNKVFECLRIKFFIEGRREQRHVARTSLCHFTTTDGSISELQVPMFGARQRSTPSILNGLCHRDEQKYSGILISTEPLATYQTTYQTTCDPPNTQESLGVNHVWFGVPLSLSPDKPDE